MTTPLTAHSSNPTPAIPSQVAARSRLGPLHAVLRAHRASWHEQEPPGAVRGQRQVLLWFAVAGLGLLVSQIGRSQIVTLSGAALVAIAMIGLVWRVVTEVSGDHGSLSRGEDDPEVAERSSVSIAALREDLLHFSAQDLADAITGRSRRLEKKSAFTASSTVWIPVWATVVTVLTALVQLLFPLVKLSFADLVKIPIVGPAVAIVGLGAMAGTVAAIILLLSGVAQSRAWLEWELEALRQAHALKGVRSTATP